MGGDDAERDVADAVEDVVVDHVAGADQLDARLVEAALDELLHELRADARGHEDEERIRLGIGDALQEGREIGIAQRHADALDRAARRLELALVKELSASMARARSR